MKIKIKEKFEILYFEHIPIPTLDFFINLEKIIIKKDKCQNTHLGGFSHLLLVIYF